MSGLKLHRDELTEVLAAVLRALRVAESKFRSAASLVSDAKVRHALLERARTWANAARELSAVARLERVAVNVVQAGARVARGSRSEDPVPLAECERCEETVALRYRDALDYRLPADVERLLMRQFDEVLNHFGTLQRLLAERSPLPGGAAA
jgi:hypothetical protein